MRYKYPKLTALASVIILAYIVFKQVDVVGNLFSGMGGLNSLGVFISGMLYSFGLTSPFSTGFFLTLHTNHIIATGIIGGIGAMISGLCVFKFIRFSFKGELMLLKEEKLFKKIRELTDKIIPRKIKRFLVIILGLILIASPLPDETGLMILAGATNIKSRFMAVISFILNTIGIIAVLKIGTMI